MEHPGKVTAAILLVLVGIPIVWNILNPKPTKELSDADFVLKSDMHILFIGDSYTSENNLPHMFQSLAETIPATPFNIDTQSYTQPNATLLDHSKNEEVMAQVKSGHWNTIILQDTALAGMNPENLQRLLDAAFYFKEAVPQDSSHIILLATWPYHPDHPDYNNVPTLQNAVNMQNKINLAYWQVAKELKLGVIYSSDVWRPVMEKFPDIMLYQKDSEHPSVQGTYATALAIYHRLFPKLELNQNFVPDTMTKQEITDIQSIFEKKEETT